MRAGGFEETRAETGRSGPARPWVWVCLLGMLGLAGGCAHYPVNAPLDSGADLSAGYRYSNLRNPTNSDELLVILTFSGGGTRAAALAYGVMEQLADTRIRVEDREVRLLDEVDLISSVSGGSFTAAYYGLFEDRLFSEFEGVFLKRNIQGKLTGLMFCPWMWWRLWSTHYNRDDLAADYFDKRIFEGKRYADLLAKGDRPYVIVNATDVAIGARFEFTQDQFDLICSDLGSFPVARAVAASSAVPGVFGSVVLKNHAKQCGEMPPSWVYEVLQDPNASTRLVNKAEEAASYANADRRRFIHLLDGGVTDNLGLRGPLNLVMMEEVAPEWKQAKPLQRAQRVLLVSVDASIRRDWGLDIAEAPGLFKLLGATTSVPLHRYSFETVELLREMLEQRRVATSKPGDPGVAAWEVYPVFLQFQSLSDEGDRRFFQSLPTSFKLKSDQVDRLRSIARRELVLSETFQRLLRDVGAEP